MATVKACRRALDDLAEMLAGVDAAVRARHVPERTIACRLSDLDCVFVARLDAHGVHDVALSQTDDPQADVRLTMTSDELVALSRGEEEFLPAWLRGRVQVSASVRDLLRLRSLFGL